VQPFFITGTDLTQEPEFDLKAQAGLLMEVNSNKIIWEENSHERLYPASLTKIMSLLVVLEQLERKYFFLEDQVQISAGASAMGGSELFLSEGDVVSLGDLLIGMAVGSANDAAVAVAEHIGGSVESFVEMMNDKAGYLGMENTNFHNPHGLHHPDHFSSAYDIMLMSLAVLEHPQIHQWATIWMDEHFLKGKIKSGEVFLSNTNRLVYSYPGCDGLKTGFTREAGNGIAATARRNQTRFLVVVLGAPTVLVGPRARRAGSSLVRSAAPGYRSGADRTRRETPAAELRGAYFYGQLRDRRAAGSLQTYYTARRPNGSLPGFIGCSQGSPDLRSAENNYFLTRAKQKP